MSATADPTSLEEPGGQGGLDFDDLMEGANGDAVDAPVDEGALEAALAEPEDRPILRPKRYPFPFPRPLPIKRATRGRYRAVTAAWQVELRVDVDGHRPMRRVSGDFYRVSGATVAYFGSFIVDAPTITTTDALVTIEGMGRFTFAAGAPRIRVTIPRSMIVQPARPATLQFLTAAGGAGANYLCAYESSYFRTVTLEQDSVAGAVPFVSYDTSSLPAPDPDRVLTVPRAFQEAGIDLQVGGTANVIPVSAAGANATWSDSEMHNAMVNHFSLFANTPQWRVWLLVATAHDGGYRGIMFDYSGTHQRQGAAVFYDAIGGSDAASRRAALRTYVHELGHAFNLLHSWDKDKADPPQPLGPNGGLGDLSWMNYTWKYQPVSGPGGDAAYWAAFPFQFTDNEVVHLRHAFRDNVIMGGSGWTKGAAEVDPLVFSEPVEDGSGFALELRARDSFAYGEPVVVELKLATTDLRGRETHGYLHPADEFTTIAVRQPSGRCVRHRPLLRHCVDHDRSLRLGPDRPAIYDSAYIGFGADGFLFEQPGVYELRAQHVLADGSRIVSPTLRIRVRQPVTEADVEAGELLLGEQQGQLLALLGSDASALQAGNDALRELTERHGDHPLAVYARLARGINCGRDFKDLTADKVVTVREAEPDAAAELLEEVEAASVGEGGVDNITLNMVMRRHAEAEARRGAVERAGAILDAMPDVFSARGVKDQVVAEIRDQAETAKAGLVDR